MLWRYLLFNVELLRHQNHALLFAKKAPINLFTLVECENCFYMKSFRRRLILVLYLWRCDLIVCGRSAHTTTWFIKRLKRQKVLRIFINVDRIWEHWRCPFAPTILCLHVCTIIQVCKKMEINTFYWYHCLNYWLMANIKIKFMEISILFKRLSCVPCQHPPDYSTVGLIKLQFLYVLQATNFINSSPLLLTMFILTININ